MPVINGIEADMQHLSRLPVLAKMVSDVAADGDGTYRVPSLDVEALRLALDYARTDPRDYVLPPDAEVARRALDMLGVDTAGLVSARELREAHARELGDMGRVMTALCVIARTRAHARFGDMRWGDFLRKILDDDDSRLKADTMSWYGARFVGDDDETRPIEPDATILARNLRSHPPIIAIQALNPEERDLYDQLHSR